MSSVRGSCRRIVECPSSPAYVVSSSQVALSMQLGFAAWPLMRLTGNRALMGEFVNPAWVKTLGWFVTVVIIGLNLKLIFSTIFPGR